MRGDFFYELLGRCCCGVPLRAWLDGIATGEPWAVMTCLGLCAIVLTTGGWFLARVVRRAWGARMRRPSGSGSDMARSGPKDVAAARARPRDPEA